METHAYFTERSIKLLKEKGRFGFIVPIALVSTDRMGSIREFIHHNSCLVKYYSFDDRPGKIFSGLEHCRATIVVTGKGTGVKKVTTSKYQRWYSENRSKLFKGLRTIDWKFDNPEDVIPKIGSKIEKRILKKLIQRTNRKTVENFLKEDGVRVWYHNAPQYWIHAHTEECLPKVEYYDSYEENKLGGIEPRNLRESKVSSHYKSVIIDHNHSVVVNGLLNSSLFYWWFVVWSDGRDLLSQHVESFFLDLDSFPRNLKKRLDPLLDELMKSYEENSNVKINRRSGGYVIRIKEIVPSKSKAIIDEIDDVFSDYYRFGDKEKAFIKEFDIEFRVN